jgi:hypothetical protein
MATALLPQKLPENGTRVTSFLANMVHPAIGEWNSALNAQT